LLNSLVTKAEGGSDQMRVIVEYIAGEDVIDLKPPPTIERK